MSKGLRCEGQFFILRIQVLRLKQPQTIPKKRRRTYQVQDQVQDLNVMLQAIQG